MKVFRWIVVLVVALAVITVAIGARSYGPEARARADVRRWEAEQSLVERERLFSESVEAIGHALRIAFTVLAIMIVVCAFLVSILGISQLVRNVRATIQILPSRALPDRAVMLPGGRVFDVRDGRAASALADSPGDAERLAVFAHRWQVAALLFASTVKRKPELSAVERHALTLVEESLENKES